jgi:DNA-binding IclR family transcriptional regulator
MYIDKVESANPVRYTVSLGERRELYSSAIGKLLLAYMEKPRREKYLRGETLRPFTPNTITSVRRLRSELDEIVREGMSRTNSERVVGASALAAPVLGPDGTLVLGIALAGPSERVRGNRAHLEKHLHEAARRLSEMVVGRARLSTL